MQKDGIVFGSIAALETLVTVSQTNEVFQTIQIIISALAGAVALAYTIWRWYRHANKDGKITGDEVDDLFEQITKKEEEKDDRN